MSMNTGTRGAQGAINVTPLIDVLLVLLIIFMVIQPTAANGLETLLPQPSRQRSENTAAVLVEAVAAHRAEPPYRLNGEPVTAVELTARLQTIYARRADKTIFIRGDGGLDYGSIVPVVDSARAAGVEHIGMLTPGTGTIQR